MSRTWLASFAEFFRDGHRARALAVILDAAGCREGWLQGEFFAAFARRPGFVLNTRSHGGPEIFDMSAGTDMVAEVKVIGADYQTKCITGGAIKPYLSREDRKVFRSDAKELALGGWGLIPDYLRLLDAPDVGPHAERLLVLVADVDPASTGSVAEALRAVDFEARASERIDLPRGFARIWDVASDG